MQKLRKQNLITRYLPKLRVLQRSPRHKAKNTKQIGMKTAQDPRHKKRQLAIQELFSLTFHNQSVSEGTSEIVKYKEKIDEQIQKAAPNFPVEKINRIDLSVLRLATYEILVRAKEPQNVIIDEAVELAKEYGQDTSPAFINGVLGKIVTYAKIS
jgi:transcription termination factor NusB